MRRLMHRCGPTFLTGRLTSKSSAAADLDFGVTSGIHVGAKKDLSNFWNEAQYYKQLDKRLDFRFGALGSTRTFEFSNS